MTSTNPSVSILMPVRNEEKYLGQALSSLVNQTFTDWELVVVDDCSTDGTRHILESAAVKDPRIRVISSSGSGLVTALNTGLAACRGGLIARMDADDIAHPKRLQQQVATLTSQPDVGLVACSFRHFPRQMVKSGMINYEKWQNALLSHASIMANLFVESPFVHPSVMFRKHIVDRLGGYRDMCWPEDYDLWLRMAGAGVVFQRLAEPLFFWRERKERATRTMSAYSSEAFRACKMHHLKDGFLRHTKEITIAGAGIEGRKWRHLLVRNGIDVAGWVDVDPAKVGKMLHGAMVVSAYTAKVEGQKLLVAITAGGRQGARKWALGKGMIEGEDFVCVS